MDIHGRIKKLCKERGITISQLEERLDFGKNTIYQWKKKVPSIDRVSKIADFFDCSIDYLYGKTDKKHYEELTEKEKTVEEKADNFIEELLNLDAISFSKGAEPMDDLTRELVLDAIQSGVELGKKIAKQREVKKENEK